MTRRPTYQIILAVLVLYPAICYRGHKLIVPDANGAVCMGLLVAALLWLRRPRTARVVQVALGEDDGTGPSPDDTQRGASLSARAWWLLGALFVVGALALLERLQPQYFTQDDGYCHLLPTVLWGCRSLWEGVFPNWNPHLLCGEPATATGIFGLTYPPTYLAYALARHALGDEYLTLEVFGVIHTLAGFAMTWWAARSMGLRPMLAALVSVCFVLSGPALIIGRSWFNFTPLTVWLPALVVAMAHLERGPVSWRWTLLTGGAIGLLFHAGFTQIWAYAVAFMFLVLAIQVLSRRITPRRAWWASAALAIGLAIAAPLAVPQAQLMGRMQRPGGRGDGASVGILSMLLPSPLVRAPLPNNWGSTDLRHAGQFYYFGTVLCAVAFVAWLALVAYRLPASAAGRNVWLVVAALAFLLALGKPAILWLIVRRLPLFDKFSYPIRFIPYFVLFASLGAGLCIERLMRRSPRARQWELGLALGVAALMGLHVSLARASFYTYGDRAYPPLPASMTRLMGPGPGQQRLLSFACLRSTRPGYTLSLKHCLPDVFDMLSFDGYDPGVERQPETMKASERLDRDPIAAAQAYGIRWLVVHQDALDPAANRGPNPAMWQFEECVAHRAQLSALMAVARPALQLPEVTVWELPRPAPMAFAVRAPRTALPAHADGSGVTVELPAQAPSSEVVVNVLWRPWMRAYANRRPVVARSDEWGRVSVHPPPEARVLQVRCEAPWRTGALLGALLALVAAAGCLWLGRADTDRA